MLCIYSLDMARRGGEMGGEVFFVMQIVFGGEWSLVVSN